MAKILHVDSSSRTKGSLTRELSQYLVEQLTKAHPGDTVVYNDLLQEAPGPLTPDSINAMFVGPEQRSESMQSDYSRLFDKYIDEVEQADVYVFGVPMYNFSVPGVFKSYIDRIVLKGRTFEYSESGFKGLLQNKKVFVVRGSGSKYEQQPMASLDFHEPYLRAVFGFIGLTDVTFIKAEGHSEEEIASSVKKAKEQIDALVGEQKLATSSR